MKSTLKKILFALIVISSFSFNAIAQDSINQQIALQYITGEPFRIYYMMYEEQPFYQNDWVKGSVTLLSDDVYADLNLKFDMYKNQLLYYNSKNKTIAVIDNNIIKSFTLVNHFGQSEIFKKYKTKMGLDVIEKFYAVLVEDSINLVINHESFIETYPYASPASKKIGKFVYKAKYGYIINQQFHTIPKTRLRLYQSFPKIKNELKHFARQNHVRMGRQEDLILIFKEINRLNRSAN